MKKIYLDNAATTKVDPEVLKVMLPYFKDDFGNPSSIHSWGQEAKKAIEDSRQKIAQLLNCKGKEIIFTSCASESNNLALKGVVEAAVGGDFKKAHLVVSSIEHHSTLDSAKHLEELGVEVTWLSVDKYGLVDPKDIERAIRPETVLVSVMYVNNEVGTIEPIREIATRLRRYKATKKKKIYFHTDAVQAVQYLDIDVNHLGVDLLSLSAHKFHGPKGVGLLFKREGVPLVRQLDGGEQEEGLRAGTENVAYIMAISKALEIARLKAQSSKLKVEKLRDKLIKGVLKIPGVHLTGHPKKRVPHIASFVVEGVEGESMILSLDEAGIASSSGSACTSRSLEPSHVLSAMGIPPRLSHGSLRLSLSSKTSKEEVEYVLEVLPKVIRRLRKMAPKI